MNTVVTQLTSGEWVVRKGADYLHSDGGWYLGAHPREGGVTPYFSSREDAKDALAVQLEHGSPLVSTLH